MNNSSRHFLTLQILIVFICVATCPAFSRQQAPDKTPGSISGHLTTGPSPLSGIEIRLLTAPHPRKQQTQIATTRTDEAGYYQFAGVAPGTYCVLPSIGELVPSDVGNYQTGLTVIVTSGADVTNINFDLSMPGRIEGQIKDSKGRPIVNQKVSLTVVGGKFNQPICPGVGSISKPSDDQGHYIVENISPGRYAVSIGGASDHVVMLLPSQAKRPVYTRTFYPAAAKYIDSTAIEITAGVTVTGIDITADGPIRTYQISGRVIDEETGVPMPNVNMGIVFTDADGPSHLESDNWKTDSNGQFRFPVILPGQVVINPTSSAAANTYGNHIDLGQINRNVTDLEIKMHHGLTISGQLVLDNPDAKLAPGALSNLRFRAIVQPSDGGSLIQSRALIAPDGYFQFAGLPPGTVELRLSDDFQSGQDNFSILKVERDGQSLRNPITIGNGEDLTGVRVNVEKLGAAGSVRGRLIVEGGTIEGIEMWAVYNRIQYEPVGVGSRPLDSRGRFAIDDLQSGDYEITIEPKMVPASDKAGSKMIERITRLTQTVKVTAGAQTNVTFTMKLKPQP